LFFFSYFLNNKKFIIFHLPYISLCILCSQNHSKTVSKRLPSTLPFFRTTNSHHFTSKNSHHVVPLIPTRCTQNSSQTIPKTAPFFPKNSTNFISKTTPLYLQNSTVTTIKTRQKRCKKKCPVDATGVGGGSGRRRATSVDGVHRRRLPPVAVACTMPLAAAAFMSRQLLKCP